MDEEAESSALMFSNGPLCALEICENDVLRRELDVLERERVDDDADRERVEDTDCGRV